MRLNLVVLAALISSSALLLAKPTQAETLSSQQEKARVLPLSASAPLDKNAPDPALASVPEAQTLSDLPPTQTNNDPVQDPLPVTDESSQRLPLHPTKGQTVTSQSKKARSPLPPSTIAATNKSTRLASALLPAFQQQQPLSLPQKEAQASPAPSPTPSKNTTPNPAKPGNNSTPTPSDTTPAIPSVSPSPQPAAPPETQVLVGEILVTTPLGQTPLPPELERQVFDAISTKPGRTTTRTQIQSDINAVFALGYFSNVQADPQDTDIGVRVTFVVQPNPVLKSVQTEGTTVLDAGVKDPKTGAIETKADVINRIFGAQLNKIINLRDLQASVKELEKYYQDKGYVLAQTADIKSQPDGTVTIVFAEGQIEDVKVAFLNEEGKTQNPDGTPIKGNTRDFIITRELSLKPGQVFNKNTVQSDLQRIFGLGIFDDVNLGLSPGTDPKKVVMTINVKERNTGSIALGAGISSATGLFGTVSFQQTNLGGNNQKLGLDIQVGQNYNLAYDISLTDPWIAGDPFHTSYTANIFLRRLYSYVFDLPPNAPANIGVGPGNADTPVENRLGFGLSFSRPLGNGITTSVGFTYQRVYMTDPTNGNLVTTDGLGNPLTISPTGTDDLILLQAAVAQDLRNDPLRPTSGSVLRVATDLALPFGNGSIFFSRIKASYSFYIPVQLLNFSEGPQALAFNVQAGTVQGTLPPYEAFQLGGSNSVRGWDQGRIGSARSFALASAEYRFPVFSILSGVLFYDFGTDLGTDSSVPGQPAVVRNKPGTGSGYGIGVRVQSPLGAIRIDYGIANDGSTQFSFGLGEKF